MRSIRIAIAIALAAVPGTVLAGQGPEAFARCLTRKGATMYGAFWCPSCRAQLRAFGDAADYLDYVECFDGDRQCEGEDIRTFPTWVFGDGSRLTGKLSFERLARQTGCVPPPVEGPRER